MRGSRETGFIQTGFGQTVFRQTGFRQTQALGRQGLSRGYIRPLNGYVGPFKRNNPKYLVAFKRVCRAFKRVYRAFMTTISSGVHYYK